MQAPQLFGCGARFVPMGFGATENARKEAALQHAPCLKRPSERYFVGELQVTAYGQAAGQARYLNAERLDKARQVSRRGFAFHVGVGGKHHFLDVLSC